MLIFFIFSFDIFSFGWTLHLSALSLHRYFDDHYLFNILVKFLSRRFSSLTGNVYDHLFIFTRWIETVVLNLIVLPIPK